MGATAPRERRAAQPTPAQPTHRATAQPHPHRYAQQHPAPRPSAGNRAAGRHGWARRHPANAGPRNPPPPNPHTGPPPNPTRTGTHNSTPHPAHPRAIVPQGGTGGRDGTPPAPGRANTTRPPLRGAARTNAPAPGQAQGTATHVRPPPLHPQGADRRRPHPPTEAGRRPRCTDRTALPRRNNYDPTAAPGLNATRDCAAPCAPTG
ncbi:hypothetical protein SHKM778_25580 [Streptomyces sp. KM77-8]|uniref:Uncharacterized protein n=1 Tax=Streptomyces haneummycinicus TaxID=3074435 RepID=A0AAT9HG71_9ACTN